MLLCTLVLVFAGMAAASKEKVVKYGKFTANHILRSNSGITIAYMDGDKVGKKMLNGNDFVSNKKECYTAIKAYMTEQAIKTKEGKTVKPGEDYETTESNKLHQFTLLKHHVTLQFTATGLKDFPDCKCDSSTPLGGCWSKH